MFNKFIRLLIITTFFIGSTVQLTVNIYILYCHYRMYVSKMNYIQTANVIWEN